MTCFSIHKSFLTALFIVSGFAVPAFPAMAQTSAPTGESKEAAPAKKLSASEQRREEMKIDAPILLELFTTSDCTACVFADRMLYDAMKNKNVIALSCQINDMTGIDLGTDTNEKSKPSAKTDPDSPMDPCVFRLWSYQPSKDSKLAIPNFIFNGYDRVASNSLNYFEQVLYQYGFANRNKTREVFIRWKDDDTISIHMPEDTKMKDQKQSASVWLIRYKDMAVEKIDEGLNKGRVLRFSNIVQNMKHVGKWHGTARTIEIDVPKPEGGKERGGYVVVSQKYMGSPVLAAGKLVDYPHANDLKKPAQKTPASPAPQAVPTKTAP